MSIAFLCVSSFTAQAQEKKATPTPSPAETEDVVRVNTELVQTDVMVFDTEGKLVNGLQPEQFELLIDGKPQPITFFDSVVTGCSGGTPCPPVVQESASGDTTGGHGGAPLQLDLCTIRVL